MDKQEQDFIKRENRLRRVWFSLTPADANECVVLFKAKTQEDANGMAQRLAQHMCITAGVVKPAGKVSYELAVDNQRNEN